MTNAIKITESQFEALRPSRESLIEFESDTEYSTETFLDDQGREIAFATYHSYEGATHYQYTAPRPRPIFDEDGNEIEAQA